MWNFQVCLAKMTDKDRPEPAEERPVCPVCGVQDCRGAVGYKCQYMEED